MIALRVYDPSHVILSIYVVRA